jgi:dCTP deaminase
MSLLSDAEIKEEVRKHNMIEPFVPETISGTNHLSYGLSAASYEVRIMPKFKIFTNSQSAIIDPIDFDHSSYVEKNELDILIPPNGFVLCVTLEKLSLPDHITALCIGKSTYARCGVIVNPTAIEAGMKGHVVLELSNTSPCPVRLRAGDNGVAKFLFYRTKPCDKPYNGNYQNQTEIVLPTTTRKNAE